MTKIFFALIFIFEFWNIVFAGTISGKIVKKGTTEAITNVKIYIPKLIVNEVSGNDGKFLIQNIPAGEYEIEFSNNFFQKLILKNVPVYSDRITYLTVELEAGTIELEPLVVTMPKKIIEQNLPATFYRMNQNTFQLYPISNISEVLALQPGVTAEGNVRGGKTSETKLLIDGIPTFDYLGGSISPELPKFVIQDLTLNSGGYEAEFGNALSGVVSVSTAQTNLEPVTFLRLETDNLISANKQTNKYSSFEIFDRDKLFTDSLTYLIGINLKLADGRWWQDLNNYIPSPTQKSLSGYGKLDYLISPLEKISLQTLIWYNNWHDYEFSWRFNLNGLPIRNEQIYRGSILYNLTTESKTTYSISFTASSILNSIGSDKPAEPFVPYQYDIYMQYILDGKKLHWAKDEQFIFTLKTDVTFEQQKDNIIKTGFDISQYNLTSEQVRIDPQMTIYHKPLEGAPMLNFGNSFNYLPRQGSFYIQNKYYYAQDGSVLSLGLRYDFLDPRSERPIVEYVPKNSGKYEQIVTGKIKSTFKSYVSPRLGLSVKMTPQTMLHVNVGQYIQFPLFNYLYAGTNPQSLARGTKNVFTGNPDLQPERTQSWEIGIKYIPNDIYLHSITFFNKKTKDQIDTKTFIPFDSKFAGDYGFAEYVNNAEANAKGIEYLFNYENPSKFNVTFSYTWMITEGVSEYVDQTLNFLQWGFNMKAVIFPLSWDQRHTIKFNIDSELPLGFKGSLIFLYNSPRPYTYYPTKDGFTPLDSSKDFLPNNYRMSDVVFLNGKLIKEIDIFKNIAPLQFFIEGKNLLNKRNVRWMDSNGRIGGELGDPTAFYELRRVKIGIELKL